MKTTNQFFKALAVILLLSIITTNVYAQEEKETKRPEYIAVTTMHWNMDMEDFSLDDWKAVEKEYLNKVTKKNEYIFSASVYLHEFTADNTELIFVQTFASWEDMDKFAKRSGELEKEAWPEEEARKAYFKKRNAYYANEHSDEIYTPLPNPKLMAEKPTKDLITYVRKSHFSFPEDGSKEDFMKLKKEGQEAIINKNENIKAYYSHVHAWGANKTDFLEVFFLDSWADLDKMYDRNSELMKEAWPDEAARKAKGKEWRRYFTGVHGDYLYKFMHELSK
ncbi:hypothetical protein A8C32_14910 [Flavivirga aquatica]|uniref:ABM domain-containing protein n=1 Tax=Flavivirga aquatica TaxID=1849968 RepID=A0A1E5T8S0_9FLAO|nr:hypothetical protein [Flavivirga aquatica]OEK07779.1 hypothetical protein A8C32_14910 [Flavivirga aquatica]